MNQCPGPVAASSTCQRTNPPLWATHHDWDGKQNEPFIFHDTVRNVCQYLKTKTTALTVLAQQSGPRLKPESGLPRWWWITLNRHHRTKHASKKKKKSNLHHALMKKHQARWMTYLWATTIVVRLTQTLFSEAWMLRSVCVSNAEVAWRQRLNILVLSPSRSHTETYLYKQNK